MSIYGDTNEDAMSIVPTQAAVGRRVGFLDAFETSYQTQVRGSAMYGIEKAMYDADAAQVDALRKAGVEDIPHLSPDAFGFFGNTSFSSDYLDAAKFYSEGGDPELAQKLQQYDTKIDELGKRFPDLQLKTSAQMWDDVRNAAQSYEKKANTERRSMLGEVGEFAGGAVGGLNLFSDPWNFATIPVGGFGKSVIRRVAGEGAAQGFIEGINQLTGVQEQRRLLGLDHGFADGLTRVAGAALGGAALQGLGEGVAAGAKRFFRSAPGDLAPSYEPPPREPLPDTSRVPDASIPANPEVAAAQLTRNPLTYENYIKEVSPLSASRAGKARTVLDVENVRTQLSDWSGPLPHEMTPKTDTAVNLPRNDFVRDQPNIFDRVADTFNADQMARQVDPDTFRVYDKLADENTVYRRWLEELGAPAENNPKIADINSRIDKLEEKAARSGAMKGKKIGKEIAALKAERENINKQVLTTDTPDKAAVRQKLMRNDEKMRDMAPVVSRAYARARNKWDNTEGDRTAIKKMIAEGRKTVGEISPHNPFEALPESLYDKAPILQQRSRVEASLPQDADSAAIASKILAEKAKDAEGIIETFRSSVNKIVKDAEDAKAGLVKPEEGVNPNEVTIPGYKDPLNLNDKLFIPNENGEGTRTITLRELLEEQAELEADTKAVASCSIL